MRVLTKPKSSTVRARTSEASELILGLANVKGSSIAVYFHYSFPSAIFQAELTTVRADTFLLEELLDFQNCLRPGNAEGHNGTG